MSIDQRLREGLRSTNEALPGPDVELALAAVTADSRGTRRPLVVVLTAAAAFVAVVVGVSVMDNGRTDSQQPIDMPTPSPSVFHASPGPDDHPISVHQRDGALVLITLDRLDRVGTATLWQREAGAWRRLGTLEHAVPPKGVAGRTHLTRGPGDQDLVALGLQGDRVGFSRDGGATWSYLPGPAECAERSCSAIFSTTDHLYVDIDGSAVRAAFGSTAWEELPVPRGSESPRRSLSLLVMDDVLLTIDSDCDITTNHYWVSRDRGDTWSGRRDFPAGTCVYSSLGNTAYTADAYEAQWWRSSDLVHWERAPISPHVERGRANAACPGPLDTDPSDEGLDEPPVRIGDEVYRIFDLTNGSQAPELRVSHDSCRTWEPVLR